MVGNGDDAAVIDPSPGSQWVVSVDAVVAGRHVPARCPPEGFATRLVGRGLSDLAAMGATPRHVLLSLTLPEFTPEWVGAFSEKLHQRLVQLGVSLIGGDTTRGPLAAHLTVIGEVPSGQAFTRRGACDGDRLWLYGRDLGGPRAYLAVLEGTLPEHPVWAERYWRPVPQIESGIALRGLAHAAIDVSDGLCQDLLHLLDAAEKPLLAELDSHALPLVEGLEAAIGRSQALEYALTGGDDYVLLVAAPADAMMPAGGVPIGTLRHAGEAALSLDGQPLPLHWTLGWDHSR